MTGYHGHKTLIDGTHVPLSADEAKSLWEYVEAAHAKRAETMPFARDALGVMLDAKQRMNDLGWWQGGGLRVRKGEDCAVAEFGSTGIWSGRLDADGKSVFYGDSVAERCRVWLKPLADLTEDERTHMEHCDKREAEAFAHEIERLVEGQR